MPQKSPIKFHPAFTTAREVSETIARRIREKDANPKKRNPIARESILEVGKNLLNGKHVREGFRTVYLWKMKSFVRRFKRFSNFPDGIADPDLERVISAAREAISNPFNRDSVGRAVETFIKLPGIGVPATSAFLFAMGSENFTIIDRQAFKALQAPFRARVADYLDYLWFCRSEALRLGVSLDCHDQALWQLGREIARAGRRC